MKIKFTKMHGLGNDYIYVNCFDEQNAKILKKIEEASIKYSERHFGIGSDGIILILPSDKADAQMRIFNADGSEGKMCGNGIRCVGKYLYDNHLVEHSQIVGADNIRPQMAQSAGNAPVGAEYLPPAEGLINQTPTITIDTLSGIKTLSLTTDSHNQVESIRVDMGKATASDCSLGTYIDIGNPHCVVFANANSEFTNLITTGDYKSPLQEKPPHLTELYLSDIGPFYEKHPLFPEGVNTEFVEIIDRTHLKMRVWERGSGETFACGTGACAVATAACFKGFCDYNTDITVHLKGGDLIINVTPETVYMTGPATSVFEGEFEI